ncbi:signal peptidase II [Pseudomonadales bacterium]|nr:signal peptidase II [Pseudomonadales bacterium]
MRYFLLSLVIVVADQWSKSLMSDLLTLCRPGDCQSIVLLPVFNFTLLHNAGAAFSFLSDAGGWQRGLLVAVSPLVSAVIVVWLYRIKSSEKLLALALALILGGAIGNLIDRALVGYVVDFIVVHYQHYYFPAFNIADSAITIGAMVLILDTLIKPKETSKVNG